MASHQDHRWNRPTCRHHRGEFLDIYPCPDVGDVYNLRPPHSFETHSKEQLLQHKTEGHGQMHPLRSQDSKVFGQCEYPRWPKYQPYTSVRWLIKVASVAFFLIALGPQIGHLVFTIKFVTTNNTGYPSDGSSYKLYKNSRFEECAARIPDAANCTVIRDALRNTPYPLVREYWDRGYTPISFQWVSKDGAGYDWCTFVSCFHGFKVLPSVPRDSTIGLTTFDLWGTLNMSVLISLYVFLKRFWNMKNRDSCNGPGIWDYTALLYTIASGIWWWVNYIKFAMEPAPKTTVSIFEWITTWLLAKEMQYHPFSCVLGKRKKYLLFLLPLAVAQYCATIHILTVGWSHTLGKGLITQSYDCVETMLPELPGGSNCSAQTLCSDTALLSDPHFAWDFIEQLMNYLALAYFAASTLMAIQPVFWSLRGEGNFWERFKRYDLEPILRPWATAAFVAVGCCFALYVLAKLDMRMNREGPVVANEACSVVHVGLSPWRYYLDIGGFARVLRIAKLWFNA